MMKHKKWIFIALAVLLAVVLYDCLWQHTHPLLSELEDEALLRYIQDCGVTLVEDADDLSTARAMIRELEVDPNNDRASGASWSYIVDLYEEMRKVVKIYYGIED